MHDPASEGQAVPRLSHPSDLELSGFLDGRLEAAAAAGVQQHLDACLACRAHIGEPQAVEATDPDDTALAGLVEASPQLDEQIVAALATPREVERTPGQLWRLEWRGHTVLAVLLDHADEGGRLVAPATTDPEWGDQYTVVVAQDRSPLAVELAVWAALRTRVAEETLDRPLGSGDHMLLKTLKAVHEAFLEGEPVEATQLEAGLQVGLPITTPGDERWEYRQQLMGGLTALGEQASADLAAPDAEEDLESLLAEYQVDPEGLAEALELPPEAVFQLLEGSRSLHPDQMRLVADRFGVPTDRLQAARARPDPDMFIALSHPRIRHRFERAAQARRRETGELREQFIAESRGLAARHTGHRLELVEGWKQIIDEWLDAPG